MARTEDCVTSADARSPDDKDTYGALKRHSAIYFFSNMSAGILGASRVLVAQDCLADRCGKFHEVM